MGERTRGGAAVAAALMLWACTDNGKSEAPEATPVNAATTPSSPSPQPRSDNRGEGPTTVMTGDMPDGGAGTDAAAPPLVDPNFVPADINHILLTGQSNSVANSARPILSTSQPYDNLMFDTGVMTCEQCDGEGCKGYDSPTGFKPLVEGDWFWSGPDEAVETSASGFANEATKLAKDVYGQAGHTMLASIHGRSGNTYACLRKGGCNYKLDYNQAFAEGEQQMQDAHALAQAMNKTHVVRAIWAIHGESDSDAVCIENDPEYNVNYPGACPTYSQPTGEFPYDGLNDYSDALLEWQKDHEASAKAKTGQKEGVPLFVSQYSGWKDTPRSKIPGMQLAAHTRAPGKVILVAPGYMLDYQDDYIHYTSTSQRILGEYFAKAYAETIIGGRPWEPLRPLSATRGGTTITVKFHVPKAPLVIDTTRVSDPGDNGFEVPGSTITSVAIGGPDTVVITLASAPATNDVHVRYAMKANKGWKPGRETGPRGNLRDSDATPSQSGAELFNWAVHFDVAVQ